jgi:hypothetical protein
MTFYVTKEAFDVYFSIPRNVIFATMIKWTGKCQYGDQEYVTRLVPRTTRKTATCISIRCAVAFEPV